MKKLLSFLLLLISFSSLSEIEYREIYANGYDISLSDFCIYQPGVQNRGELVWELYFPNEKDGITATSICIFEDAYGQYGEIGELVKGFKQGAWINYHRNGQKKSEQNYIDGISNGMFTKWSKTGQKLFESKMKNEKWDGEFLTWYLDGQIKTKLFYKDSQLDGAVNFWQDNGKKWIEAVFVNGKRIGECKIINEWDIEKAAVERSPTYAENVKRNTKQVNRMFCGDN